jgi:hypothetical protein
MGDGKKEKWFQVLKANHLRGERCRKRELISELVSVLTPVSAACNLTLLARYNLAA